MKKILLLSLLGLAVLAGCSNEDSDGARLGPGKDGSPASVQPGDSSGLLTAGEWSDLNHWGFWDSLIHRPGAEAMLQNWKMYPTRRFSVQLLTADAMPAADIPVELTDSLGAVIWRARTDNQGKAELWAGFYGQPAVSAMRLRIDGGALSSEALRLYPDGVNRYTVAQFEPLTQKVLDLAFVVDATGSMGDEITFLKSDLQNVIARVRSSNSNGQINLGAIFYRDESDDYLTRKADLTPDIQATINFIRAQEAGGGGDFPEAAEVGLNEAISQFSWSPKATARVVFLILDAPPHQNPAVLSKLQTTLADAAAKGIKVVPITASGIDKNTEFLMRALALGTNGTYVFITDHSSIGNSHLEATVGPYQVEYLNNLMVRLLNQYLE